MIEKHLKAIAAKGFEFADNEQGNRFLVRESHGGLFAIGRVSVGGTGGASIKIGATRFDSLSDALAKLKAEQPVAAVSELESIRRFLDRSRTLAASHVYGTAFAVAKVTPQHGWRWHVAKLSNGKVMLRDGDYADRGAALAVVNKIGGNAPTLDLSSLPCRPVGLFAV